MSSLSTIDGQLYIWNDVLESTSNNPYILSSKGDTLRLCDPRTIVTTEDPGHIGELCWDDEYFYVCVGSNQWKRTTLTVW